MKSISLFLLKADVLGGIQLMTVDTIKVLVEHGYNVMLITSRISDIIKTYLEKIPQEKLTIYKVRDISNITLQMFLSKFLYKNKDSISINMHGDIQTIEADIIYFHQFNVDYRIRSPLSQKLKLLPQYIIRSGFINKIKKENKIVLVNSSWTQAEAEYFWNLNSMILYPPVHTEKYIKINNTDRQERVLTISRFSRDRGLEKVLKVAKELPKYEFVIAGYVQDRTYFEYLENNKPQNVLLLSNISEEDKMKLLSTSKVYFNPTPYIEGFGTAIVEGMSAGLIPVTRDKGGVIDFVPKRFMFSDDNQIVDKIILAMKWWDEEEMNNMKNIANYFSFERYEKELIDIINKIE